MSCLKYCSSNAQLLTAQGKSSYLQLPEIRKLRMKWLRRASARFPHVKPCIFLTVKHTISWVCGKCYSAIIYWNVNSWIWNSRNPRRTPPAPADALPAQCSARTRALAMLSRLSTSCGAFPSSPPSIQNRCTGAGKTLLSPGTTCGLVVN